MSVKKMRLQDNIFKLAIAAIFLMLASLIESMFDGKRSKSDEDSGFDVDPLTFDPARFDQMRFDAMKADLYISEALRQYTER